MLELMQEMLRGEREPPPAGRLLGMRLTHVTKGQAAFELDADLLRGEAAAGRSA
jgi:hypothetical protein